MKEFVESLKEHVNQRLGSPFIAPFTISLLAWNWDLAVALLGAGDYEHKIFYIETILLRDRWHQLLLWPALSAAAFLVLASLLNAGAAIVSGWGKNLQKAASDWIDEKRSISREEREEMHRDFEAQRAKAKTEIDQLHERLSKVVGKEKVFVELHRMHVAAEVANRPAHQWPKEDLIPLMEEYNQLPISWPWKFNDLEAPKLDRLQEIARLGVPRGWLLAIDKCGPDTYFEAKDFVKQIGSPEQGLLALNVLVAICAVDVTWTDGLMYKATHSLEPKLANLAGRAVRPGWQP